MKELYPGGKFEEYVTTSKIVTPEYDEGSYTKDGVLYIFNIYGWRWK